jgi:hypothetical protein
MSKRIVATAFILICSSCLVNLGGTSFTKGSITGKPVNHYVFFAHERERITEKSFLETPAFEGAQLKYTWRELEPEKDQYDFSSIRKDLAFLTSHGKKLFIQLQEVSFDAKWKLVPNYLLTPEYHGGVAPQYDNDVDEDHPRIAGWVARRWDPPVQSRFQKLLDALGKEFDGKIEGINLPETSVVFGKTAKLFADGFTYETYRDAIITNMKALKRAFPKSVVMQYANFMPGEWLPDNDKSYLRTVYEEARNLRVGVGGPDLLPFRWGQRNHSYPLIRASAGSVPTGIAVQDGNYADEDRRTHKRASVAELLKFATEELNVDYIFWCTEEPYYSKELIPFLRGR